MNAVTHYAEDNQQLIGAARGKFEKLSKASLTELNEAIAMANDPEFPEFLVDCLYQSVIISGNTLTIYNGHEEKVESFQL